MLKLSEAVELGIFLEPPGSPLSFKACAVGLGMAAVSIPAKERTARKAAELWPWLRHVSRTSLFGLHRVDHMREIGDWYFNVRLGRMTMATLVSRIRHIEPAEPREVSEGVLAGARQTNHPME